MKWEFSNLAEIQSSDLSWSLGRVVHSRLIFVLTFPRYFRRSLCTCLFTCSIFSLKVACGISSVVTKMTTPVWLTCESLIGFGRQQTSKEKSDHPADYFLLLPLYEVLPLIIETPARRLTRETTRWPSERSRRREESGAGKWQVVSGVRDVSRRRNYRVKEVPHPWLHARFPLIRRRSLEEHRCSLLVGCFYCFRKCGLIFIKTIMVMMYVMFKESCAGWTEWKHMKSNSVQRTWKRRSTESIFLMWKYTNKRIKTGV